MVSCSADHDSQVVYRFDIDLDSRLEYLTLAVANAKSHPISAGGRHETAITFLTDLEEKLDVAQVQLEIYHTLLPHVNDAPEVGERIKLLSKQLFTMTDVRLFYYLQYSPLRADFNSDSCIKSLLFHSICQPSSCFACMYQNTETRVLCGQYGIRSSTRVRIFDIAFGQLNEV